MRIFTLIMIFISFCPLAADAKYTFTHYLGNDVLHGIAFEKNYIWCATDNGVVRFDKTTGNSDRYVVEDGLSTNKILCVAIDHNGVKWFGTSRKGVSWFDGANWYSHQSFNWAKVPDILSIAVDGRNTKWFLGTEGWMTSYNGESWIDTPGSGCDITVDSQNRVWIATTNPTVILYNPADSILQEIGTVNGWTFTAVAEDKNHVMWFGAEEGVEYFDGENTVIYDNSIVKNMPSYIYSVAVDKNNVKWFGTESALWSFDGKEWKCYSNDDDSFFPVRIFDVEVDDDGIVWTASQEGLSAFHPDFTSDVTDSRFPDQFRITRIFPNPFNPSSTISFSLQSADAVNLAVYDITGRRVRTLVSGRITTGSHYAVWDGRDDSGRSVSSGVYIARLESGRSAQSMKMLLMR